MRRSVLGGRRLASARRFGRLADDRGFTQLVVVGSSAGGIDALSRLVAGLPSGFAAPIVVAQDIDPTRVSHLHEILGRRTSLRVVTLETVERLEPGVIYVVPANRNVKISDHSVAVAADSLTGPMPSIDRLLRSASGAFGENLIAVILSGAGSDAAAGARAVKVGGGAVIIQDPETAGFSSMPVSVGPATVDVVATADAIGPLLADLVSGDFRPVPGRDDTALAILLDRLRDQSGIDFGRARRPTILRRLERRMVVTGVSTIRDYVDYLEGHPEEGQRLLSSLLIHDDSSARQGEMELLATSLANQQRITEEERARLSAVLSGIRDAIVMVGAHGEVTYSNDAYQELAAHADPMLEVPETADGVTGTLGERAARGESFVGSFVRLDGNGRRHWYEVIGRPVAVASNSRGGLIVIRDITERSLRQLQQEFTAMVAHELRTPLTALRGYLQLLRQARSGADGDKERFASLAMEQADRLQALVADLFDTARLDTGKLELHVVETDLRGLILEAVDIARTLTTRQRVSADVPSQPLPVRVDRGRIQQVFMNILSNAMIHAASSRSVEVRVHEVDGFVEVRFVDHGPGLGPEELPQIFARYRQAGATGSSTGLGLGLFISREIVTAHGGSIAAEATPGGGTTIAVRLPPAAPDAADQLDRKRSTSA
jgi:PAS domain S-box-containing protein